MTLDRFQQIVNEFLSAVEQLRQSKSNEYATGEDVLQNFKEIATFGSAPPYAVRLPSDVCLDYLLKHVQAIKNAVLTRRYAWVWQRPDGSEGLKQRIADSILYLLLLAACLDEESTHAETCGDRSNG